MAKRTATKRIAKSTANGTTVQPTNNLADRVRKDRVARRLTWPAYAAWIGVKLSTIYKIAQGATGKPHELTLDLIERKLAEPVKPAAESGAAREVVPSG